MFKPLRQLYDWIISWADKPSAQPALFGLALVEASFCPIPPDPLLMALALGNRSKAFRFALVCTTGSVLGGLLGYFLGFALQGFITTILQFFIDTLTGAGSFLGTTAAGAAIDVNGTALLFGGKAVYQDAMLWQVYRLYQNNAFLAVFGAAVTPIPFIVFTLAAGYCKISIFTLLIASTLGRGARYFAISGLLYLFGARVKTLIEKHFEWMTLLLFALLIGIYLLLKYH